MKYLALKNLNVMTLEQEKPKEISLKANQTYDENLFQPEVLQTLITDKALIKLNEVFNCEVKKYNNPLSLTTQFYFCPVPLRLDTYSGCSHACKYCFANNSKTKYINASNQAQTNTTSGIFPTTFESVKKYFDIAFEGKLNTFDNQEALAIECLKHKVPIHFGGMSDPLQPLEEKTGITYKVLALLKSYEYPVIFSTKGKLILNDKYYNIISDYKNFGLQISLIDDREEVIKILDPNAMSVEERLKAFELYQNKWTACRIQPFIIGLSEERIIPLLDKLHQRKVNHVMVEGLKFFSGNLEANKLISDAFKQITGKPYDLLAYFKSIGAFHSGNDVELPSWRKYMYAKIFKEELHKRGMTFGCADNDLRFLGDSPCCCGVDGLSGFENTIKHNTGHAVFRALKNNQKTFDKEIIKGEWFPEGTFRQVISKEKLKKKFGYNATYKDANMPLMKLFNEAWEKGGKNSPCDMCNVKLLGGSKYRFLTEEELNKELKINLKKFEQKNLF